MCSTIDLLPTFAHLADAQVPQDRVIDGENIAPILKNPDEAESLHEAFYFYQIDQLQAVRSGPWKLHLPLESKKRNWGEPIGKVPQQLFNLENDIDESEDVSEQHPQVVKRLLSLAEKARKSLGDMEQIGEHQRPAGWVEEPKPLTRN